MCLSDHNWFTLDTGMEVTTRAQCLSHKHKQTRCMGHLHAIIAAWRAWASSKYGRSFEVGPIQSCGQRANNHHVRSSTHIKFIINSPLSLLFDLLGHIAPQVTLVRGCCFVSMVVKMNCAENKQILRRTPQSPSHFAQHLLVTAFCTSQLAIVNILKLRRLTVCALCYDGNRLSFAVLLI